MDILRRSLFVGLGLWFVLAGPARSQDADPAAEVHSEPTFIAFGDSAAPPSAERVRDVLERAGAVPFRESGDEPDAATPASEGTSGGGLPPEVAAQMRPIYEKSIADLEAQLAGLDPAKDAQRRASLERMIAETRANLAYLTGEGPAPEAAGESKRRLRVRLVPEGALTRPQAMQSLYQILRDNCTPEALAAFAASDEARDARRSAAAGAAAMLANNPLAALVALLRATELEPGNPSHVVNLAAVTQRLGLPRHTLAILEGLDEQHTPHPGAFGVPGRAIMLTTRGHALVQLGRLDEAERTLREAVRLSSELSEARINLAHALYRQDDPRKKEEAMRFMGVARRRATVEAAQEANTPPPLPPEQPAEPPAPEGGELSDADFERILDARNGGRPPAAAVFDLSRGKRGRLPTIKIPRTIAEGAAMHEKLRAFYEQKAAQDAAIIDRMNELENVMRQRERDGLVSPASARRARDVFWYIAHSETQPGFRAMHRTKHRASFDRGVGQFGGQTGNPFASHELMEEQDRILAADHDTATTHRLMRDAAEAHHSSWQAPIRNLYNEVGLYFQAEYPYMTALAANLADPVHHEYASLMIRRKANARLSEVLGPLMVVVNWDMHYAQIWSLPDDASATAEDIQDGDYPAPDACPHHMRGESKVKALVAFAEISGNCEKIGVEVSAGEWVKLFDEVDVTFDGEVGVFVGGAGEAGPQGGGLQTAVKTGFFVKVNAKGEVIDFGAKATRASGVSLAVGGAGYEGEIQTEFGLVAAFSGG